MEENTMQPMERVVDKHDNEMWKGTPYQGMSFEIETDWDSVPEGFASPIFKFENGDRVIIDREGKLNKIVQ